jgi:hypothetical protein
MPLKPQRFARLLFVVAAVSMPVWAQMDVKATF